MSSDKVAHTKETVTESTEKTKNQMDAANKEAEAQLDAANKSDDPTFADQARQKAAHAKDSAAKAHEKLTGAVTDGWSKTKDKFNSMNQYPDKK